MKAPDGKRRPQAFRLDEADVAPDEANTTQRRPAERDFRIEPAPDPYEVPPGDPAGSPEEALIETAQRRGMLRGRLLTWGGMFWSALGGLVALAFGLAVNNLIDDLFVRAAGLGWVGLVLLGVLLLSIIVIAGRELTSVLRQRRIAEMHAGFAAAHLADDRDAARRLVGELARLYEQRPQTARARAEVSRLSGEIVDGRDLIDITERELMQALDTEAQREVANAARRVSLVTAISPRALLDVLFVAAQAIRLIRRISEIYGGRPGLFGFFALARSVGAHLAVTGGMAAGDSLVQQLLGHGIAARLSARLGEGVLNGLLTARVGLSAIAVCRPMPFVVIGRPGVKEVAPFLFGDEKPIDPANGKGYQRPE